MKKATGELNLSVVVLVSIGILSAFFFTILWPMIKSSMIANSKCRDAICDKRTVQDGLATCRYYKDGKQQGDSFKCVWKG